jgi:hypothetical protein
MQIQGQAKIRMGNQQDFTSHAQARKQPTKKTEQQQTPPAPAKHQKKPVNWSFDSCNYTSAKIIFAVLSCQELNP